MNIQTLLEAKNLHMDHLDDAVVDEGSKGVKDALKIVKAMEKVLNGHVSKQHDITVKWDGSPAIFCGKNPSNGKFFVGSKSVFNKTPKINYTEADINRNHSGGLADTLKIALRNLKKLKIDGVLQGDVLYTNKELKSQKIDGENYITFTPNTITYAVPAQSNLAKTILRSEIGVIFHTEYKGTSLESMIASFGPSVAGLKRTASVWFDDATFKDESGTATFTKSEINKIDSRIEKIEGLLDRTTAKTMDAMLSKPKIKDFIKIYYNTLVRSGSFGTASSLYKGFVEYINGRYEQEIAGMKSERGRQSKTQQRDDLISFIRTNSKSLIKMFTIQSLLRELKLIIVRKIEQVKSIGLFLQTSDGFKVTAPEGFVAIDRLSNRAYKLVDRLTFSQANFNAAKKWDK